MNAWEPVGDAPLERMAESELYRQAAQEIGEWDPSRGTQIDHIKRIAKRARELMGGRGEEER